MANQASKVAVGMSTGAAVIAALAWLKSGKVEASPPGTIPEELMNLVIAIANSADKVDANTLETIAAIEKLALEGGLGWPPNAEGITSLRVAVVATGVRMPFIAIPSGMSLVIKAWALNPGWLQVGSSLGECVNVNQSFPLLPNEIVGYQVLNANKICIAATAAGCFACLTVEQRKGGGG